MFMKIRVPMLSRLLRSDARRAAGSAVLEPAGEFSLSEVAPGWA